MIGMLKNPIIELTAEEIFDELLPKCHRIANQAGFRSDPRNLESANRAIGLARDLIQPESIYRVLNPEESLDWPGVSGHRCVVISACTVGKPIVDKIVLLTNQNHLSDSLFLDAAASVAVEKLAEITDVTAGDFVLQTHKKRSRRVSPGYPGYPMELQKRIFGFLPAEKISIRLTSGQMMDPVKSISFFFCAGDNPEISYVENRCNGCSAVQCPFRNSNLSEDQF